MKGKLRRALALLFALVMVLTLTVPALAEGDASQETPAPQETEQEETSLTGESGQPEENTKPEEHAMPEETAPTDTDDDEETVKSLENGGEQDEETAYLELHLSASGNDETGDGSADTPFATLERAAKAANAAEESVVYLCIHGDLSVRSSARFQGKDVILLGVDGVSVLTRAEGFATARDSLRGVYHPAMIELGTPEDSPIPSGSLTLENVVLDDAGRHEGSVYASAETEKPAADPETAGESENGEAEEAAGKAAEETPEETAENTENSDKVQNGIVAVYRGGKLTLSAGAELRNFGGLSAVWLEGNSSLVLESGSAIRDTMELGPALPAISRSEQARVETFEGAVVQERSELQEEAPQFDAAPIPQIQQTEDVTFTGPKTLTRIQDSSLLHYDLDYSLQFSVSENMKTAIEAAQSLGAVTGGDGVITVRLDQRLSLQPEETKLISGVFALDGEPAFDEEGHILTAPIRLTDDWADHLDELTQPMSFSCRGRLSAADFTESTAEKDEFIITQAQVTLNIQTAKGKAADLNSGEKTVKTKMLGLPSATLRYDVNGGDEGSGPETELVSAQSACPLSKEPVPSHAPVEGTDVVFLGWTTQPESKIYARGEEKPATVEEVSVSALESTTVYAVYGYDKNGDGIADVNQRLATLSFDANGGENAPEPITHVVGSVDEDGLGVNIPEQEPNRDYYTFLGWGEKADATKADKLYKYDAEKSGRRDIPVSEDKTLYAVWEKNYTLYYDANGGENAPAAQTLKTQTKTGTDSKGEAVYAGRTVIASGKPSRSGYKFEGWAVSRRGKAAYFAGDQVEISGGNVTLYAVWTRDGSPSGGGSGGSGNKGAPKTGDSSVLPYVLLLGLGAAGLGTTAVFCIRKKKAE